MAASRAIAAPKTWGPGTRTICGMVVAETLGLPLEAIKVNIGHSTYPFSGASGGSTTVGAVSESHRRAAQDALRRLNELVAKKLGVVGRDAAGRGRSHRCRRRGRQEPQLEGSLQPDRHHAAGGHRQLSSVAASRRCPAAVSAACRWRMWPSIPRRAW